MLFTSESSHLTIGDRVWVLLVCENDPAPIPMIGLIARDGYVRADGEDRPTSFFMFGDLIVTPTVEYEKPAATRPGDGWIDTWFPLFGDHHRSDVVEVWDGKDVRKAVYVGDALASSWRCPETGSKVHNVSAWRPLCP